MDLVTLITTCSLAKDSTLVLAMALAFSHGDPFTVTAAADVSDVSFYDSAEDEDEPRTKEAALADMQRMKAPLVGLLPVPLAWAGRYQATPAQLLDACMNISVATAQLSLYERECSSSKRRDVRSCALRSYAESAEVPLFEIAVLDTLSGGELPSVYVTDAILSAGVVVGAGPQPRTRGANRVIVPERNRQPSAPSEPAPPNAKTSGAQPPPHNKPKTTR